MHALDHATALRSDYMQVDAHYRTDASAQSTYLVISKKPSSNPPKSSWASFRMAQWIRRPPTERKIPGSIPGVEAPLFVGTSPFCMDALPPKNVGTISICMDPLPPKNV